MVAIVHLPLETPAHDPWLVIVASARTWLAEQGVAVRDAIVLLPFAEHLPLARRAWARAGGWLPRIDTTMTLARSLGPAPPAEAAQICFDAALDRLTARRLLRTQSWVQAWERRDPRGVDQAIGAVVQTAHGLARAASAVAPAQRAAYWSRGRELLAVSSGPGMTERLLARLAFEWAASGTVSITDGLFALRPSAWIVVKAGADDALARALIDATSEVPSLIVDADVTADDPFACLPPAIVLSTALCRDFEDEAQRTAAHVLDHLNQGVQPVALIAQDRLLMRRVRALLSRQQVSIRDETGWKLSTTRAGAQVAALLRAAGPTSDADDWLDWLKGCSDGWPQHADAARALELIESRMRREGWVTPRSVDPAHLPERAAALWQAACTVLTRLAAPRTRPFTAWLVALRDALQASGAWLALQSDDAGRQALAALHLLDAPRGADELTDAMSLQDFTAWVDDALENASFIPEAAGEAEASVVITPLARAMLRPFAAALLPGADEKRLGASPKPHALLSDTLAQQLGLPDASQRRTEETLAFAQLLRLPRVTLLRRLDDGGEPLASSPLLERLRLALARAGRDDMPMAIDPRTSRRLLRTPVQRPAPAAADLLPVRLSASACEALRACPYRFYALRMLRVREAEELDDTVEKRDYGTWLHAVLHRFHVARQTPPSAAQEEAQLHAIAAELQHEMRLDEAAFLPFAATFARFVPRYIAWLYERDAQGAQWLDGERELVAMPPEWRGVEMEGVIDRIDSVPRDDGPVTQLIDYKTGSGKLLRELVKQPQEDTQLAFYAALMSQQSHALGDIEAVYLPLDDSEGIKAIEHADVATTAHELIVGIGHDLERLRAGAGMPALGEARICDFCEARGLCRRDHWSAEGER